MRVCSRAVYCSWALRNYARLAPRRASSSSSSSSCGYTPVLRNTVTGAHYWTYLGTGRRTLRGDEEHSKKIVGVFTFRCYVPLLAVCYHRFSAPCVRRAGRNTCGSAGRGVHAESVSPAASMCDSHGGGKRGWTVVLTWRVCMCVCEIVVLSSKRRKSFYCDSRMFSTEFRWHE